jgi:hypothetical protein
MQVARANSKPASKGPLHASTAEYLFAIFLTIFNTVVVVFEDAIDAMHQKL